MGEIAGGETGARLTRLLQVALEREPERLRLAWEAMTAFQSVHGPLEAVLRDQAASPVRRLAALGAVLAMSDTALAFRAGGGAVTHDLIVWASALLLTEPRPAPYDPDSLQGHARQVLLTRCDHTEWRPSRRAPPIPVRRALIDLSPDDAAERDRVRAAAIAGVPVVFLRCAEGDEARPCPWAHGLRLHDLVRILSLAVDRWLVAAKAREGATRSETSDPLLVAALDKDSREEWIDQGTAARFLGVERRTLQAYAGMDGFPRSRREGRRKLYPVLALTRWAHAENRACWSDALPERVWLALRARVPTTRTVSEDQAIEDGLRKQRDR